MPLTGAAQALDIGYRPSGAGRGGPFFPALKRRAIQIEPLRGKTVSDLYVGAALRGEACGLVSRGHDELRKQQTGNIVISIRYRIRRSAEAHRRLFVFLCGEYSL